MSEWISVIDRMPDPLASEYATDTHLITDGEVVVIAEFVFWPPWTWILRKDMKPVTHWMPLPAPPRG